MVKPSRDDIKKEIEEGEKLVSGEGTLGSGAPDPEVDDDTDKAMEEVIGNQPKGTLAEEIEKDERGKRDIPPDK